MASIRADKTVERWTMQIQFDQSELLENYVDSWPSQKEVAGSHLAGVVLIFHYLMESGTLQESGIYAQFCGPQVGQIYLYMHRQLFEDVSYALRTAKMTDTKNEIVSFA